MQIDLSRVPFSRYGSYLAFSHLPAEPEQIAGLYLRSVRGPATGGRPMQEMLRLQAEQDGQPVNFEATADFCLLTLTTETGEAHICLPAAERIRIRLQGVALRMEMPAGAYDNIIPGAAGSWLLTVNSVVETKLQFCALSGQIVVDAPWQSEHSEYIRLTLLPGADGSAEFEITESTVNWPDEGTPNTQGLGQEIHPQRLGFSETLAGIRAELQRFTESLPTVPQRFSETRELAGYVLWSCVVNPEGHLTRPTIFASKNGMIGSWSWDHAFHTFALAGGLPDLAWAQMMTIFDQQDSSGALPDLVNDRLLSWSFCKPPIHGWALSRLEHTGLLTEERLQEITPKLEKWTEWWFAQRDSDHDGIPQCNHGNDGGWDNSTVFSVRPPVESPEISAYLVMQMDFLARACEKLEQPAAAQHWKDRADALLQRLLEHFWREDHFVAVQVSEHVEFETDSLLLLMPLVLAERLPASIRTKLIARLKIPAHSPSGEFLTAHGLATESLKSPSYKARGYWRGPIWPAPTLMLIDALQRCGEKDFAAELTLHFCELVQREGMAENFDALSGQGYHDFHFAWTAGIFLTLAHQLQ